MPHVPIGQPALLVVDMQEEFRPYGEGIMTELNKSIKACRENNIPVYFSQHGHTDDELSGKTRSATASWWGFNGSIRIGSPAWQLLPELDRKEGDGVIRKNTYDMFQDTGLRDELEAQGINTVIVSGVMTNLCCGTTAVSAMTKNFAVLFLRDGTATSTDKMHEDTLDNIAFGFGEVLTCAELRKRTASGAERRNGGASTEPMRRPG